MRFGKLLVVALFLPVNVLTVSVSPVQSTISKTSGVPVPLLASFPSGSSGGAGPFPLKKSS